MRYENIDKDACRTLRADLQALIDNSGLFENLNIQIGNMKFTNSSVEMKASATILGAKTAKEDTIDRHLVYFAKVNNLTLEPRNNKKLVGYNSRSHKYPYLYENMVDGKRYKCDEYTAKRYFG